jgi:hypothetical protein
MTDMERYKLKIVIEPAMRMNAGEELAHPTDILRAAFRDELAVHGDLDKAVRSCLPGWEYGTYKLREDRKKRVHILSRHEPDLRVNSYLSQV